MKIFFLVTFFLAGLRLAAQQEFNQDSLLIILQKTNTDTGRTTQYFNLGRGLANTDPEAAMGYLKKGLALAGKNNQDEKIPDFYLAMGICYNLLGKNDTAIAILGRSIKLAEEQQDIAVQVDALSLLGYLYTSDAKFETAASELFKALTLSEQINDAERTAKVYSSLSNLFYNQNNYGKGIFYGEKGLALLQKGTNPMKLGAAYLNLGLIYADTKDFVKARKYYFNAVSILKNSRLNFTSPLPMGTSACYHPTA